MPYKRAAALVGLLLIPPVFAASPETGKHVDRKWFGEALREESARWRQLAPRPNGFFAVSFDRQWRPAAKQTGTLVSQSRQIFVMLAGYERTHERAYMDAATKGADFLLRHFRDPENGLFFFSTTPDGEVIDDGKDSYGLAFTILALSHAARVTRNKRYSDAALETWTQMKQHLQDETGLFRPKMDRSYTRVIGRNTQNPMMHLFEALLALHDATGSKEVLHDAQSLADAIFTRLYDQREGRLPELFESDWKPGSSERPGHIELGHQFEWAYLLSRAVEKGFPESYLTIGERLLDYGMKLAYDGEAGGIFSHLDAQEAVVRGPKEWWEQCELLRTLMHYAIVRGRDDLWPAFDQSLEFTKKHLIDAEYGGWFYSYDPTGATQRTEKGSIWQAGYHVCGFYFEALRLTGGLR